jgi:hypothetical protein
MLFIFLKEVIFMKHFLSTTFIFLGFAISSQAIPAKVNFINCSGSSSAGLTTVNNVVSTISGSFVTISNIPFMGLPFIQQAQIMGGNSSGKNLDLKLHTMITNQDLTLRLENQSSKGYLYGSNGRAQVLNCQASIN